MRQILAFLALLLTIASIGLAHAVLLEATPAANGAVSGPDIMVHLRFNSRIDRSRSRLALVLPDRSIRVLSLGDQSSPAILNARATGLSRGSYRLEWQVLATDGHISRGEVPFQVK
jgi:methionine-rich copper-binding protein CopC